MKPAVRVLPAVPRGEPQPLRVAPEKLVAGDPRHTVWLDHESSCGEFCVGIWASEVGEWRVRYTEEEYCSILEGRSVVTDEAGHAVTVTAGMEFVIPAGFVGTWPVEEPTRKRFVIHERASGCT
jgi:uncharacterized cupin superfamily protein